MLYLEEFFQKFHELKPPFGIPKTIIPDFSGDLIKLVGIHLHGDILRVSEKAPLYHVVL